MAIWASYEPGSTFKILTLSAAVNEGKVDLLKDTFYAGDIGSTELADRLAAFRPLRAVCGNCDGGDLRRMFPEVLRFKCEEVDVLMKHIGGYPGNYDRSIVGRIYSSPPKLFISGHSHILKVKYDKTLGLLHINPGAAGQPFT